MSGVGTHELATQRGRSRGQTGLRADLAHDYAKAYGRDPIRPCLDWLERFGRWRGRLPGHEQRTVVRSVRQLADAFDLPHNGAKDAHQRYRKQVVNTLTYLREMGWVLSFEALYEANGEGRGILIRWAPVAQLDRPRPYGTRRPGGCPEPSSAPQEPPGAGCPGGGSEPASSFFSDPLSTPLREEASLRSASEFPLLFSEDISLVGERRGERARSCLPTSRAEHAWRHRMVIRATAWLSMSSGNDAERAGVELSELPWIAEVPVTALARLLHQLFLPDVPARISAKRQAQLEAAARRMDRIDGPGAWIRYATHCLADWAEGGEYPDPSWLSGPPRSLGALALSMRREANCWRHGRLERRRERIRPLAAARHRQQVKRWRVEARAGWWPAKPWAPTSGPASPRSRDRGADG